MKPSNPLAKLAALTWGLGLSACAAEAPSSEAEREQDVTQDVSPVALQIERAERQLDRGGDAQKARAALEGALADPEITPAERDRAALALSRAYQTAEQHEQAIAIIEEQLAAHADDRSWHERPFTNRLRELLTGSESAQGLALPPNEPVAPFAHVLAPYFAEDADGVVKARIFIAAYESNLGDPLGALNIRGALREQKERDCPFCDNRISVSQSVSHSDWTIIPARQQQFAGALTVFYFDLGKNRIPARYEAHLPRKVADIEADLAEGRSFVVAEERPGAPPSLLLAAPRTVLLRDVEKHLAELDHLPTEVEYVEVRKGLPAEEIRAVVRGQLFSKARQCYDELLERDPQAQGKLVLDFAIARDGSLERCEVITESPDLRDEAFLGCVDRAAKAMTFPAPKTGTVTVRYPVVVPPDKER